MLGPLEEVRAERQFAGGGPPLAAKARSGGARARARVSSAAGHPRDALRRSRERVPTCRQPLGSGALLAIPRAEGRKA